jgi:hypothetical protein
MRRNYPILAAVFFICVVAVYFFFPTDENRIRKTINTGERAVESEDIDGLMKRVSYNYQDDYGNNYLLLRKRLTDTFRRLHNITVEKQFSRIAIQEERAEVELSVRVLASHNSASVRDETDRGYIVGDSLRGNTVHVFLEKSMQKWLITGVDGVFD